MTSISPDVGSVEGGQTVTVTGRGFLKSHTSVEIGGVPCEVQSVSPTEVVCVTGPKPEDAKYYPGQFVVFVRLILRVTVRCPVQNCTHTFCIEVVLLVKYSGVGTKFGWLALVT